MGKGKSRRKRRQKQRQAEHQFHDTIMASLGQQVQDLASREELKDLIKKRGKEMLQAAQSNVTQIMVNNLRYELSWRSIKAYFQDDLGCAVSFCKLFHNHKTGQSRGQALLTFSSPESVKQIMERSAEQLVRHGRGGTSRRNVLQARIGHRGSLWVRIYDPRYQFKCRVKPHPPRRVDVMEGVLDQDRIKVSAVMVGSFGQEGEFLEAHQLGNAGMEASAKLQGRVMTVTLERGRQLHKLELLYKHAGKMALHRDTNGELSLLCPLRRPPKLYRSNPNKGEDWLEELMFNLTMKDMSVRIPIVPHTEEEEEDLRWEREGDFCATTMKVSYTTLERSTQKVTMDTAAESGPLGSNYVYRLLLPYSLEQLRSWNGLLEKLYKYRMLEEYPRPSLVPIVPVPFKRPREGGFHIFQAPLEMSNADLEVLYRLGCLVSQGYIPECRLGDKLCEAILEEEADLAAEVLSAMLGGRKPMPDPLGRFLDLSQELGDAQEEDLKDTPPRQVPSTQMDIKRVLLTPTRVVGLGVEPETSNRVLRAFSRHKGRFMRVAFGEEDGNRLRGGERLFARVRAVLQEGIWVGQVHFQFLAFSSSQLRDQSCWFFAPEGGITADSIRRWMGDFSSIKVVGKYAARMGQCFSTTVDAADIKGSEWRSGMRDVERGEYCFTDGCGTLSPLLAKDIAEGLWAQGRVPPGQVPTAYQIRFSGVKGMVAVDPRLRGRRLCTRPSMEIFSATHSKLEVIRPAGYMAAYLNRQIVQLLSTLGVPDHTFLTLQRQMTEELTAMTRSPEAAASVVAKYRGCINGDVADALLCMLEAGTSCRDPFVHGVLVALRALLMQDLRHRTRILVERGCSLIGVSDETGTLAPDEVFICYQKPGTEGPPTIRTGPVLLTKNPCYHVGDIRVVQAVDRPDLHHSSYCSLTWDAPLNVVVFSQQGRRPLPNMMAGSDLDGDIYFACWDERLFPPSHRRNMQPLDYAVIQPLVKDEVTVSDLQDFLVNFALNDNLGQIAHAWVAWADQSDLGAEDPRCHHLATLHSQAVDFAKHGRPAILGLDDRPQEYPDFMNKKDKLTYTSNNVLGVLYREVLQQAVEAKQELLRLPREVSREGGEVFDPGLHPGHLLGSEEFQQELDIALGARFDYETEVAQLMNQFKVHSEAELLSGCISKWSKYYKRRDTYDLKQQITDAVRELRQRFLDEFEADLEAPAGEGGEAEDAEGLDGDSPEHARERARVIRALAWYYVTYHPDMRGERRNKGPKLFSFPWLVADHLASIKRYRQAQGF